MNTTCCLITSSLMSAIRYLRVSPFQFLHATDDFTNILINEDLLQCYASIPAVYKGTNLECIPAGTTLDIKTRLLNYVDFDLVAIYLLVGCNNLKRWYRGDPGYNGGYGKQISMLLQSSSRFNIQLEQMCDNFSVSFVDANHRVPKRDFSRDSKHFNRRGVSHLGSLLVNMLFHLLAEYRCSTCLSGGNHVSVRLCL